MSTNDDYRETFKQEAIELLVTIEQTVLDLEDDPKDIVAINKLFRAMHTIKGSGSMFGFDTVSDFTHHVETALDEVRKGNLEVDKKLIDLVLASRDIINDLLEDEDSVDITVFQGLIAQLKALISNSIDKSSEKNGDAISPSENNTEIKNKFSIAFRPSANIMASGMDPILLLDELRELGDCQIKMNTENVPLLSDLQPDQLYVGWQIELSTIKGINEIEDVFVFLDEDSIIEIEQVSAVSSLPVVEIVSSSELNGLEEEMADAKVEEVVPVVDDIFVPKENTAEKEELSKVVDSPKVVEPRGDSDNNLVVEGDAEPVVESVLESYKNNIAEEKELPKVEAPLEVDSSKVVEPRGDSDNNLVVEGDAVPRLGEILLDDGIIKADELKSSLSKQKKLGAVLIERDIISEDQLEVALEKQKKCAKKRDVVTSASVRVPSERLDKLVNLVGELVITQARLSQEATKIGSIDLETPVEDIDRLTSELRDIVLNIRMLPIGTIFSKFRRLIRSLSGELEKELELVTEGEETELDKTILEKLDNPLVHLIRNSADHGIETPLEREKAGKSRRGLVKLSASHQGGKIIVKIEDDGKGMDKDVIFAKAVERGLVGADEKLSPKEIFAFIFNAGFSTAKSVTSVSGRGVGMDVVRREIEALHGTVQIESEKGVGSSITIALPLTLSIIDGLMVEVGGARYIMPLNMVEECQELNKQELNIVDGRDVFSLRGQMAPLVSLRKFFAISADKSKSEQLVVINSDDSLYGLVVDKIIGDYQAVIKPIGHAYKDAEGISGATILGDGSVALILDVHNIIATIKKEKQ